MAEERLKKLNWWHESIIDWMLNNPDGKLADCAAYHNCSQSWLSVVINSEAFKAAYDLRREDHSALVSASIVQKCQAIAHLSLDAIAEKLENEKEDISPKFLLETSELALKALGYGPQKVAAPGSVNIQNNTFVTADAKLINEARERAALTRQGVLLEQRVETTSS